VALKHQNKIFVTRCASLFQREEGFTMSGEKKAAAAPKSKLEALASDLLLGELLTNKTRKNKKKKKKKKRQKKVSRCFVGLDLTQFNQVVPLELCPRL
jgi:hypothetical protein